jgi:hypothetical protein
MYTYKIIGSFSPEHLTTWVTENTKRLHSQWKVFGHAIIKFHPSRAVPFVYKSLSNIHVDSIADLEQKFPQHFTLVVIQESMSMYGRPTTNEVIYPVGDVYYTNNIENFTCYIDTDKLKFDISMAHWKNDQTFTTENIFLEDSDRITETKDTIEIDFNNKKLISSIIEM